MTGASNFFNLDTLQEKDDSGGGPPPTSSRPKTPPRPKTTTTATRPAPAQAAPNSTRVGQFQTKIPSTTTSTAATTLSSSSPLRMPGTITTPNKKPPAKTGSSGSLGGIKKVPAPTPKGKLVMPKKISPATPAQTKLLAVDYKCQLHQYPLPLVE